jgi:hypothetical protein
MYYVLVIHNVSDYRKWRPVFDAHEESRVQAGLTNPRVLRNTEHPEELIVSLQAENVRLAREFFSSEDLRNALQAGGVSSSPRLYFLEEV